MPATEEYRDAMCDYMPAMTICRGRKSGEWKKAIVVGQRPWSKTQFIDGAWCDSGRRPVKPDVYKPPEKGEKSESSKLEKLENEYIKGSPEESFKLNWVKFMWKKMKKFMRGPPGPRLMKVTGYKKQRKEHKKQDRGY